MGQSLFLRFANTVMTLIFLLYLYHIHIFCKAYICMKHIVDCSGQIKVKEISEQIPNPEILLLIFFHIFHNYKKTISYATPEPKREHVTAFVFQLEMTTLVKPVNGSPSFWAFPTPPMQRACPRLMIMEKMRYIDIALVR